MEKYGESISLLHGKGTELRRGFCTNSTTIVYSVNAWIFRGWIRWAWRSMYETSDVPDSMCSGSTSPCTLPQLDTFSLGFFSTEIRYRTGDGPFSCCIYIYKMDLLRQVVVLVVCYFSGFITIAFLGATEMECALKLALAMYIVQCNIHVHISFN